jgi:gas vesicle protein
MTEKLNLKIDSLEEKVAESKKRITEQVIDKITKVFDKRISTEVSKIKKDFTKDMENRLSDLKSELTNDMEEVNQRLEEKRWPNCKLQKLR